MLVDLQRPSHRAGAHLQLCQALAEMLQILIKGRKIRLGEDGESGTDGQPLQSGHGAAIEIELGKHLLSPGRGNLREAGL